MLPAMLARGIARAAWPAARPARWLEPATTGSCRTYFASKWQKRLGYLLEHRRRPPVPKIPSVEVFDEVKSTEVNPTNSILGSKRCGALAYKIGCMSLWDEWGQRHMITVCQLDRLHVLQQRTLAKDGYEALQLGLGFRSIYRQRKTNLGLFIKAGVGPKHKIVEFRVSSDCMLPVGHQITARHFVAGQWVFVSGWSKGKGFQGPVKRWGFAGMPATRGTEKTHRAHGSVGQKGAGLVWKNKKMAGHMGPDPRCVNAQVFRIEAERGLIFLKGALPGYKGSCIKIHDARGKTALKNEHIRLPYPTFAPQTDVEYPVTMQEPPPERDPFLYPEQPLYQPGDA